MIGLLLRCQKEASNCPIMLRRNMIFHTCVWLALAAVQHVSLVQAVRFWPLDRNKNDYTPLVFFTLPPGLSPEVDAMEQAVRKVERQLHVRVERMDLLRQPESEAVLRSVGRGMAAPPYLYHRESLQVYSMTPTKSGGGDDDEESEAARRYSVPVDVDRIRAWAKGRYLPPKVEQKIGGIKVFAPTRVASRGDDGNTEDEDELLEELTMTPLQRKGKQAMKERTEELASRNADS